jgi:polar amino acid transport system substrate-binding protein
VALGDYKGPGWDIALELARRMGVKVEAVEATGAKVDELAAANGWDIGIVVLSADMDTKYANAGPLLRAETGYLVPAGSAIKTMADIDKPGVKVAMFKTASTYSKLEAALTNAKMVGVTSVDEAVNLLKTGGAQAFANAKPRMGQAQAALPGSTILDGAIATTDYGIYGPKANEARLAYLKEFVASIKASGFLKAAADKYAVPGLIPAP